MTDYLVNSVPVVLEGESSVDDDVDLRCSGLDSPPDFFQTSFQGKLPAWKARGDSGYGHKMVSLVSAKRLEGIRNPENQFE